MTTGDLTTTGEPVELTCENYCALYATGCADFSKYANDQDCLSQCKQWPEGIAGETAGDSLGCRLYHVGVANQVDANVHCPHAGPTGADVCVAADPPQCQDYCDTYLKNCTDKLNAHLLQKARGSSDLGFLASPVTGGGVSLGRISQLFLLAVSQGKKQPSDWAQMVWQILASQGQKIIKEGKTLETVEENIAELTAQASTFADKQLAILKAMQIA